MKKQKPAVPLRVTAHGIRVKSQVQAGYNHFDWKCVKCYGNCDLHKDKYFCQSQCDLVC